MLIERLSSLRRGTSQTGLALLMLVAAGCGALKVDIVGEAMAPTLRNGDSALATRSIDRIVRGDIVCARQGSSAGPTRPIHAMVPAVTPPTRSTRRARRWSPGMLLTTVTMLMAAKPIPSRISADTSDGVDRA